MATFDTSESRGDINHRFTYHAPREGQPEIYETIRAFGREAAHAIDQYAPPSREKSLALTKLEEAVMWANAAIARHPEAEPPVVISVPQAWGDEPCI